MHEVAAIFAPDYAPDIGAIVEGVQLELLRDLLADADAAKAIAMRVNGGCEYADPNLAGNDCNDAARDPALGGHADLVRPFASIIVHAAGIHHRQHVAHVFRLEHFLSGDWIGAVIGEHRRHDGEIAGGDVDRALAEIEVEHVVWIAFDHARVEHHVGDGAIAVACSLLGAKHRLVDTERSPGEIAEQREHVDGTLFL